MQLQENDVLELNRLQEWCIKNGLSWKLFYNDDANYFSISVGKMEKDKFKAIYVSNNTNKLNYEIREMIKKIKIDVAKPKKQM